MGIFAAAQDSGEAQEAGKVGPPLETAKAFGNDFRNQNWQKGQGEGRVFVFSRAGECVTSCY